MSAVGRLPFIVGTLGAGAAMVAFVSVPALREVVARYTGISAPGGVWRVLAIAFALLNIKTLPFVWHWRVFRHIFHHLYFNKHHMTRATLFTPLITSSYNSLTECDYNLHKSNSTYFSDLDASRAALVGALIRNSLAKLNRGDVSGLSQEAIAAKGKYIIALGGIACTFRKEIAPLERFDVWTKVLTWDEKWIYIISHVVRKGAKKPTRFHLQPWKKQRSSKSENGKSVEPKDWTKAVFATSIAKYVCKKGRLTIPPEVFLTRGDLLPPKPASLSSDTFADTEDDRSAASTLFSKKSESPAADLSTWEGVERERRRGLQIAKNFDSLALLHGEFGADDEVLGEYSDFLW